MALHARVGELLEFGVDVGAVGHSGDAEEVLQVGGDLLSELVGEDVADLVCDDAGDLIFAAGVGDELAGDVDAATCKAEAVDLRGLDEDDAELEGGGRQRSEQAGGDAIEIGVGGGIFDGFVVALNQVGHGVAEPLLLLFGKDVGAG